MRLDGRVDVGEMGLVVTAGVDGTGGAAGRVEETGGCVEADGSDAAGGGEDRSSETAGVVYSPARVPRAHSDGLSVVVIMRWYGSNQAGVCAEVHRSHSPFDASLADSRRWCAAAWVSTGRGEGRSRLTIGSRASVEGAG